MPTTTLDPALLSKLDLLRLSVRWMRWGHQLGGRFVINRRGSSIEFADYTAYSPGDDIRSIDWKLYARLDKLFVKTHKEEVELAVEIIVDATASMGLPTAEKFRRACQIALAAGCIGLGSHHRVRVSWVGPGPIRPSLAFSHRADVRRLTELIDAAQPTGAATLAQWMPRAIAALRIRGGQAIVISDWMMRPAESFQALHLLSRRHLEVKVIQVLSPQELEPARMFRGGVLIDSETGTTHELAYSPAELVRAVVEHNEQLARFCKRHGMLFAQHRLDEPLETFLLQTLPQRGFFEPRH